MFLGPVENSSHAFRRAGIVIQKIFDAGKISGFLHVAVLKIIVARIADAQVIRPDLFTAMHLVFTYRPAPAKSDIIAPAVGVVGGNIGVNFVAIKLIGRSTRRDAAIDRQYESGEADIVLIVRGLSSRDQTRSEEHTSEL